MDHGISINYVKNKNSLVDRIPDTEWERFRVHLQTVELLPREVLYEREQPVQHVYFPLQGCIALLIDFTDGFRAQAGLVGREGMVGVPLLHGVETDIASAVVLVATRALRIPAAVFVQQLAVLPGLRRLLMCYGEAVRAQTAQMVACNGHHSLDARFARLLLTLQDRCAQDDLPLTHELIATLLSAHRPSISVAAKRLQRAGVVQYAAGRLVISDRAALETAACECYDVIRAHTKALMDQAVI